MKIDFTGVQLAASGCREVPLNDGISRDICGIETSDRPSQALVAQQTRGI
jgi:hypothetical protein